MKTMYKITQIGVLAVLACSGVWLVSCSPSPEPSAMQATTPVVAAPLSMAGKTLVLDHSQAQVAQIGVGAGDCDVFSPAWQSTANWMTRQEYPYNQWYASILFTADVTTVPLDEGGKETHTYQKTSDTEAQVSVRRDYGEDEFYKCDMKLKFISPTEAEAQYYHYGVDDISYFFRNVRAIVK